MVAHPGLDVLIPVLTCGVAVRAVARSSRRPTVVCPAGTGRRWLSAVLCAEYVLKSRTHVRYFSRLEPNHAGAVGRPLKLAGRGI